MNKTEKKSRKIKINITYFFSFLCRLLSSYLPSLFREHVHNILKINEQHRLSYLSAHSDIQSQLSHSSS